MATPSADSAGVRVAATDPPAGAQWIGPVEAVHGHGCGLFGKDGTLEGATNALKEAAMRRGANYVRLVSQVEPHMKRDCFDHEYRVSGVLYRVGAPAGATPRTCEPPCSPGYACAAGTCRAVCNPPCAAGEECQRDRVCRRSLGSQAAPAATPPAVHAQ